MVKKVLGLDLGTNSIGWALVEESDGKPSSIIDLGSRIFVKAVEEKIPTPKNVKRRDARLARRVIQRRSRRKQKMRNYLVELELLPKEIQGNSPQLEGTLNKLGDPYKLRAKALDESLNAHELGRVLLHLVQRRGFLSNRKTLLGDMIDDPDVLDILNELESEEDNSSEHAKEETAFKKDITELKNTISENGFRTLGEYLASLNHHECKRNRSATGSHLRTDRQMYRDELELILDKQEQFHPVLTSIVKEQIQEIIFFQRPIKLRSDRVGKCSLEPKRKRARMARLECQRFRYLQDINNLQYFDTHSEKSMSISKEEKDKLVELFENEINVTFPKIRKTLGFDRRTEFNLEAGNKKLKGNITACEIRKVLSDWDNLDSNEQLSLVEDLVTINKKSTLKKRLLNHWSFPLATVIDLCLLEFEPGHSNHSSKAINKLLPFLRDGHIYSDARQKAGYDYKVEDTEVNERLGMPPEIANPIVQKGLHELRRLINAIIAEHGKPDAIRIEMARDLEMNTKRYKAFIAQQKKNTKANEIATEEYKKIAAKEKHLHLSNYPNRYEKIKYRLWIDQNKQCAYSGGMINLSTLFSPEIEIDHILPFSESLDDSYMNKVVCFTSENRGKGQRTPIDAFSDNADKWNAITGALDRWDKSLKTKKNRFFTKADDLQKRDFISSQLNDTRYISKVALEYLKKLGVDISVNKGITTSWVRHQWGLNSLIGETAEKERIDHRHHAIDALVIACIDRSFYNTLVRLAKDLEKKQSELKMNDIHFDPPWNSLRSDLNRKLKSVVVSHAPIRKLTGALHEETGVGFIDGVGTVYRKSLDTSFGLAQVSKIIDPVVQLIVREHLSAYNNDPKKAFADEIVVYHKDGVTPIKRVRIVQSKTTLSKLEKTKFNVKDHSGKPFKWFAYGNIHHVEIVKNRKTGGVRGHFVTTLEAHQRAKGIHILKQPIIKMDHGNEMDFLMALHKNDLVSIKVNDETIFYRVQKLERETNRILLRLHSTTVINNKHEEIHVTINESSLSKWKLEKRNINVIGKLIS